MNPDVIMAVVFTVLILFSFSAINILFVVTFIFKKNMVNNVDITIYELAKEGMRIRFEKGRFKHNTKYGKTLVTVGFWPFSEKDNLGYAIGDNDIHPSKGNVFGARYHVAVAVKDGLCSPLRPTRKKSVIKKLFNKEDDLLEITEQERKLFKEVSAKLMHPVDISENPESLSLTPILSEQVRFKLDVTQDAHDYYRNGDKEFAKTMIKLAVLFAFAVLVFAGVVIIVIITQGGSIAQAAVNVAPNLPPG